MSLEVERLGESAWLLRLGASLDPVLNARVHAIADTLRAADLPGLEDIVPAYASVLLRADTATALSARGAETLPPAWQAALASARRIAETDAPCEAEEGALHLIPVCYGDTCGEDLEAVARHTGLSPAEIVHRHTTATYRVAMLGFAPGFAYLLGMDPALQVPRHERPRTRVPTGSIGLAGMQTGVYPSVLPGGWQLIGRTPRRLVDLGDAQRPCLLAPGDRVRFEAIDRERFEAMQTEAHDA